MRTIPFLLAIAIMLTAISSEARWQDRLYPFRELTDEMVAQIDLKDGSIEDWLEVLGEPTLTGLDFAGYPDDYDPSSYDCRLWLAWHEAADRLYIAAEIVDDIYVDIEKPSSGYYGDSTVWFFVDGDMSGGNLRDRVSFFHMMQAQHYTAFARTYRNKSNVDLEIVISTWMDQLPYADGGGDMVDSQPILSVVEFFVTPFDHLIWDAPEESVISDLFEGKAIGFALSLADMDSENIKDSSGILRPDNWLELFGPDAAGHRYTAESHLWATGILLGADGAGDSAVESFTWGRIKASLAE